MGAISKKLYRSFDSRWKAWFALGLLCIASLTVIFPFIQITKGWFYGIIFIIAGVSLFKIIQLIGEGKSERYFLIFAAGAQETKGIIEHWLGREGFSVSTGFTKKEYQVVGN
jgi:hypothetical protein